MKQYLLSVCILFVCISGTLLLPQRSYGQLSGAYTINPAKAASSTNYKSWEAAVGDLVSGTRTDGGTALGPGVNSAVTFSVHDTVYATNVVIYPISGASAINRITFKSAKGDSSKCVLQYASSSTSADDYVLLLDGADYITFQQIGFERTGSNTYSTVIQITNNADNNKFIGCSMIGIKQASNTTNTFNYGTGSCIYYTGNGDSTLISKCRLLYGYNGIYCTISGTANLFSDNVIDTSGSSGILMGFQTSLKITQNTFNMGDFGANASQYVSYATRIENSRSFEISKNKMYLLAVNATTSRAIILFQDTCTASKPAMVYNNMIVNSGAQPTSASANGCSGLAAYTCTYVNFHFNNVLILNSRADASAFFHNSAFTSTNINVLNNNLINKAGGYAYNVPGTNTADLDSINFNNVYTSGTNIGNWTGSNYSSLSSWQSASGKDAKSLNIDPGFINNSNLHISNLGLKGKGIPYYRVKDDIDGELRDVNTPFIGADELPPAPNDAGMVGINKPAANTCGAVLPVEAIIKNYGTSALTKATINWSVNGVPQTAYSWTGNLSTNKQDTVTIGTFNFTTVLSPKFTLRTVLPNGQNDGFPLNDSIVIVRSLRGPPAANAGSDFGLCLGDSALVGPVNNPTNSYKWMTMSNTVFANTSQTYVKPSTKTSYIMEVKSNSFGCIARDTITVDVNSKPTADAGLDMTICPNGTTQIGKPAQTGFSYSWTSNPSGFTSTTADPNVSPSVTTTYTLVKTVTATGCKASDQMKVTVNSLPTPMVTGTSTVCIGEMLNYTTALVTGSSYKWALNGGKLISGQNTNTLKVQWNVADTGYLKVIETNTSTCKDSSLLKVIVIGKPKAGLTVSDVCKGSTSTFNNVSIDALTNNWDFGDGGTSTQTNPTHLYTSATNFNIRLIVKNSYNCADTAFDVAVVHPIPVANFGLKKTAEKTFDFMDSSTVSAGTITKWHWEFGDGDTSVLQTPNHQYAAAGGYNVKLCVTTFAGCRNCINKTSNVLGFVNPLVANKMNVNPNPGTGIFNVRSEYPAQSAEVCNTLGQVITRLNPDAFNFSIDLREQPAGIYILRIRTGDAFSAIRLIKE